MVPRISQSRLPVSRTYVRTTTFFFVVSLPLTWLCLKFCNNMHMTIWFRRNEKYYIYIWRTVVSGIISIRGVQVYLRFGAARLMPNARLTNIMGGCRGEGGGDGSPRAGPRYLACGIDWKSGLLAAGVERVWSWVESRPLRSPESARRLPGQFVTLDVLVPSFRWFGDTHTMSVAKC